MAFNALPASPFVLSAPDNGSFMLRGDAPHPVCSGCGRVADREWVDPSFTLVRAGLDASYTYDGYLIVSTRAKDALGHSGARYIPLPAAVGYYVLLVDGLVPFDVARRKTWVEQPCPGCGRPRVVAGATPAFLKVSSVPGNALLRTDVEFGTGDEQHPLIVVGWRLANELRTANLAGIELQAIDPPSAPAWTT